MNNLSSVNGNIGIAPFKGGKQIEKKMSGGMMVASPFAELASSEVIVGNKDYPTGSTVYFSGGAIGQGWAKKTYLIEGVEFILAPENQIFFVSKPPQMFPSVYRSTSSANPSEF